MTVDSRTIKDLPYKIGTTFTAVENFIVYDNPGGVYKSSNIGYGYAGATCTVTVMWGPEDEYRYHAPIHIKVINPEGSSQESTEGWAYIEPYEEEYDKGIAFPQGAGSKPTSNLATHTYNYTGKSQSCGYGSGTYYSIGGTSSATDICEMHNKTYYSAYAILNSGCLWSDWSSGSVELRWKIQGGAVYLYKPITVDGVTTYWQKSLANVYYNNKWNLALPYVYQESDKKWHLTTF